jgi:hypothetical protein
MINSNYFRILIILLCLQTTNIFSQHVYLNFGTSYNFSAAPSFQICNNMDIVTTTGTNSYVSGRNYNLIENISFGNGFQYGGAVGLLISKNFSLELGVNYLKSNTYEDNYIERHKDYDNFYNQKFHARMLRFSPSVKISIGDKIKPYLKTGLIIGLGSKIEVEETINFMSQSNTSNTGMIYQLSNYELHGGLSFGYLSSIGINVELSKKIGIFSEINIITQSWSPKYLSYTKIFQNGRDVMSYVTTDQKEIEFVDALNNAVPSSNTDDPSQQLKKSIPFSSIGLNLGIFVYL